MIVLVENFAGGVFGSADAVDAPARDETAADRSARDIAEHHGRECLREQRSLFDSHDLRLTT